MATTKFVYDFAEGNRDLRDLLGGKGANLAEMTNIGLPVPPGFTITTEACRAYLASGAEPDGLAEEIDGHLAALEQRMGRRLGDPSDPLLVSVRSGAAFSTSEISRASARASPALAFPMASRARSAALTRSPAGSSGAPRCSRARTST